MTAPRSFPAFRTDPVNSLKISWWSCAIGYVVILLVVPIAAAGLGELAAMFLRDKGVMHTAAGPALRYGESLLNLLSYSTVAAWTGAILSIPIVILARQHAFFGWAVAMLAGMGVGVVGLGLYMGIGPSEALLAFGVPNAILGLTFWATVRLIHPSAFADTSHSTNNPSSQFR